MAELKAKGEDAAFVSCLGHCDVAPATWVRDAEPEIPSTGLTPSSPELSVDLAGTDDLAYDALALAKEKAGSWVVSELETSGIQGRGGAGFPAFIKWRAIRDQAEIERYVVLNADEGEPGTFKDPITSG